MTAHDRFLELAAAAIDFELSRGEVAALQGHLAGCEICRRRGAQLRADARAVAALPLLRAGWNVPALDVTRGVRRRGTASLRFLATAALGLALAGGILVVGGEILRQQVVAPTASPGPSPTAGPSTTPPTASPSFESDPGQWQIENLEVGDLPFGIAAVTALESRLVAVGWRTCVPVSEPTDCWANAFTSDDGGSSWSLAPRSDALRVGFGGIGSGPEPGMLDVAAGHGGFLAIGYDELFRAATWTSVDGQAWTESPADDTWDSARVRAVAATATGWVVGGEVFLDSGPRAAIWTSPDGVTWTRAPDGPAFDIGGYLDTGEEPGSGGIADVIARGAVTIAVGSSCDDNGFECVPAAWTSTGGPWIRTLGGSMFVGRLRAVASFRENLIAAGYQQCAPAPCSDVESLAVALRSPDGVGWTASGVPGTSGTIGFRALGTADGYLVGVLEGVEGIPGLDLGQTGELILATSVDGETWELLDNVPDLGLTDMSDVGVATTADGSVVIVGWGAVSSPEADFRPFVVRVTRTPG